MEEYLYGSICLSDIPKEFITTGRNGKKYLNVNITKRRTPSQYGQTHNIKVYVPKEQQKQGMNYYIGELKTGGQQQTISPTTLPKQPSAPQQQDSNDLPF